MHYGTYSKFICTAKKTLRHPQAGCRPLIIGLERKMPRIKLTVAYKGTNYCGFQIQPNQTTIEGMLNEALTALTGTPTAVIGASRTDSGVHALGNVAVFDTDMQIPAQKVAYALNARLPHDIVVTASEEVPDTFHPRKCVSEKTYEYRILNTKFPNPLIADITHFYHYDLDVQKMQAAAAYLVGEHDFTAFCSAKTATQTNVRTVFDITVKRTEDTVTVRVTGNGFLYNMVRIIAGTLIEVGNGRRTPESVKEALESRDRNASGPTAPACGLTLIGIKYQ